MAVLKLELRPARPFADGRAFGMVGPYTLLEGTAHFAIDPRRDANRPVADIGLAAADQSGMVRFSADFQILMPVYPERGNRSLLFDVPNRGHRLALWMLNGAPRQPPPGDPIDPGDGFLMRRGYTLAWCGWQHDVPTIDGLMRIRVPEARSGGRPVSGPVMVTFMPTAVTQSQRLADRLHQPHPASDTNDQAARLFVLDENEVPREIARDQWSFAVSRDGALLPDDCHIHMAAGFLPGRRYQVVYTTTGAAMVGLGMLVPRDFGAFLRRADGGNPVAKLFDRAYAFGASQSGRYLRQWLHLGLNEDEDGRMVFDGVIAHIAGGIGGNFNERFGQPSNTLGPSLGGLFPFADADQTDPETGRVDGLLKRLNARSRTPKIFFINSSSEYWRGDGSLIHTSIDGRRDESLSPNLRNYHLAGTQHGPGVLPLTDTFVAPGFTYRCRYLLNSVDHIPLLRAALVRMDAWVRTGAPPPASCYPRLDNGTAVPRESTGQVFATLPGVQFPRYMPRVSRLDFGPGAAEGVATVLPPKRGADYPSLVSAVDRDGNERAGIRMPDISVPLATYTGWNFFHEDMGAGDHIVQFMGATIPFARTRAERESTGDPRASIQERYATKDHYLDCVLRAAGELVEAGYLLAEDVERVRKTAYLRYELLMR